MEDCTETPLDDPGQDSRESIDSKGTIDV